MLEKGLQEVTMHGFIAVQAGELPEFYGGPADRIIVASALFSAATLVTAEEKILGWPQLSGTQNARE